MNLPMPNSVDRLYILLNREYLKMYPLRKFIDMINKLLELKILILVEDKTIIESKKV